MSEFIEGLTTRLSEAFDPARAGEALAAVLTGLLVGAAVLVAYWILWRMARRGLSLLNRRLKADRTSAAFSETLLKYALLGVGTVHAIDSAGINTAGILASLGVVGLTIGFAARDALSNIVSGILIFWDRPFVLGDLVEIDGQYGRVDRITLRSTRVVTTDGRMLAVPNTAVIGETVASYTNFPHLRLDIPLTLGVEEDIPRARRILLSVVADDPAFMTEPAPRVLMTSVNDYNVAIEFQVWLDNERDHVATRAGLRERAFEALRREGVEMPFETLVVRGLAEVG